MPTPSASSNSVGNMIPLEAHTAIRVVFIDEQLVLADEPGQRVAALEGQGAAARVLERRDRVDDARRTMALERVGECAHVEAVVAKGKRFDLRTQGPERQERSVVARLLPRSRGRPRRAAAASRS